MVANFGWSPEIHAPKPRNDSTLCPGPRQSSDPVPGAPTGGIRLPIARGLHQPESGGRVKGGAAAEPCEGTLEAQEHSGSVDAAMGSRPIRATIRSSSPREPDTFRRRTPIFMMHGWAKAHSDFWETSPKSKGFATFGEFRRRYAAFPDRPGPVAMLQQPGLLADRWRMSIVSAPPFNPLRRRQ